MLWSVEGRTKPTYMPERCRKATIHVHSGPHKTLGVIIRPRLHSGGRTLRPDTVCAARNVHCRLGNTMTDDEEQAATWRELAVAAVFGFLAGYGAVALVTHLIVGYQYTAGTLHPWPCSPGLQPASTMSEGARALKHGTGATANAQTGATGPQTVLHAFSRKRLCTILMQLCRWPPRSIGGLAEHGLTARYVTLPLCFRWPRAQRQVLEKQAI